MSEHSELADVTQANLDDQALQDLLEDLTTRCEILELTTKGGELSKAEKTPQTLEQSVESLKRGEIRGIQVRYISQGEPWVDTLLRGEAGIRVVRMKMQSGSLQ